MILSAHVLPFESFRGLILPSGRQGFHARSASSASLSTALLLESLPVRRQTDSAQRLVDRLFRRAARSEIHCCLAEDLRGNWQRRRRRHQVPHCMEEEALHFFPVGSPDAFDRHAARTVRAALDGQIVGMAQDQRIPMLAAISEVIGRA